MVALAARSSGGSTEISSQTKITTVMLGLGCYLDHKGPLGSRCGICVDSLLRIPQGARYDYVVIDESEQVLAHFLSDTIEHRQGGGRERLFVEFQRIVAQAKYVVALDADLSWPTFQTLLHMVSSVQTGAEGKKIFTPSKPLRVWINESKSGGEGREIQIYASETHLMAELKQAVAEGKRCFVTSNTKARIEKISAALGQEFGASIKQIVITSATVNRQEVKDFIAHVKTKALDYDVILTSPSLGTGVDISFPDQAQLVDVVFGFFEAMITTHFDCDQQIARVRNAKAVKVWFSPRRFQFETNAEVVRWDLIRQSLFVNLLSYDERGEPVYQDAPLVDMAALIVAQQRASLNNLKRHFVEYKKRQGWTVTDVGADEAAKEVGKLLNRIGKLASEASRISNLLNAKPVQMSEFKRIEERHESGETIAEADAWSFERTRLELFYRQVASEDLIKLDKGGRYRSRVTRFRAITRDRFFAIVREFTGENLEDRLRFLRSERDIELAVWRLVERTPIVRNGQFDPSVTFDMGDLTEFVRYALDNKAQIESQLGFNVRRDIGIKPVQQLNEVLKLIGLRVVKAGSIKKADRKTYRYRLDLDALKRVTDIVDARERSKGWDFVAELHGWSIDEADDDQGEDGASD